MAAFPTFLTSLMAAAALLVPMTPTSSMQRRTLPLHYGVNLSSAGFAPDKLPGVHGTDYLYPNGKIAEPFAAMGMNTVRLPFLWERLQPKQFGEFNAAEAARLDQSVAAFAGFKTIILDVHNYARFRDQPLDKMSRGGEALADLWSKLATRYATNPRIAFGLMNEPHGVSAVAWRRMVDQSIGAIRRSGAKQLILVPGVRWTGGAAWFDGGSDSSASAMTGVKDPANNFLFEIHQYFDRDNSGTSSKCVSRTIGRQRLAAVTAWLRKERAGGLLGEFGSSVEPTCLAALNDTLVFMESNGDVWRGWTYWAGGDWWGDYPYSIQPVAGKPRPQGMVLKQHLTRYQRAAMGDKRNAQPAR